MINEIVKYSKVKFIFYHIEKCAGTSLRHELNNYFSEFINSEYIFMPELSNIDKSINLTHHNIQTIKNIGYKYIQYLYKIKVILCHISCNDTQFHFHPEFAITCIRNPITRVISHYNFFDKPTFQKEFYELTDKEFDLWFRQKGNLMIFRLTNSHHNLLLAKQNILKMNHVILFENYKYDIIILGNKLKKHFGRTFRYNHIQRNCNPKNNIQYSSIFIDKIISKLKDELELYYFYKKCKRRFKNLFS
jgi:hypothetical protein